MAIKSPSAVADAVNRTYKSLLNRSAGTDGLKYWVDQIEKDKQAAMAGGMSEEQALATATAKMESDIGASNEAKVYADTGIARKAIQGTESFNTVDDTPDWYTAGTYTDDDVNEFASGTRDEDWATKLDSGNLAGFLSDQN